MNFVGRRYYNLHRILLSSIGLWPYQDPKTKKIKIVISFVILVSSVIVQLMKFVTTEYSLDLLLKILSFVVPCIVFVLKYVSFCVGTETVRNIMENVISDWSLLKTEVELQIIKKYSEFGRLYTIFFALMVYPAFFIYLFIQFMPSFLDIVAPQNESRLHSIPLTAEYFADQQKYYFPILVHINLIAVVGFTTVISTETLFSTYIQHAIAMFEVASYRIEHAFDEILGLDISRKNCSYCTKIINAISIHNRAIKFAEILRSSFTTSYFFLICLGILSLTANLVRFFLITQYLDDLEERVIVMFIIVGHIYYIFLGNYFGQKLTDHSTDVFRRIYVSQWYIAPPHAQKLLLFMMQQSINGISISLGGLFIPSLEGFTTITSMSISYFAVIRSM